MFFFDFYFVFPEWRITPLFLRRYSWGMGFWDSLRDSSFEVSPLFRSLWLGFLDLCLMTSNSYTNPPKGDAFHCKWCSELPCCHAPPQARQCLKEILQSAELPDSTGPEHSERPLRMSSLPNWLIRPRKGFLFGCWYWNGWESDLGIGHMRYTSFGQ